MAKSLGIAMILGLFVTGLGHIYIGYIQRGIIFLIIAIFLVSQIIAFPEWSLFGILIALPIYIWTLADLYHLFKRDEKLTIKPETSCVKCGFNNQVNSEYCIKCGSRLQSSCPNCGQLTNPQMLFCGKCGVSPSK